MSHRTISINPQFFNMSKKKKTKIIPSQVNINSSNIRQLLLDKLKEHKKTRKIETKITPLQEKSFDEISEKEKEQIDQNENDKVVENVSNMNGTMNPTMNSTINANESKPYGNLKNGTKPTFKQLYKGSEISETVEKTERPFPENETERKVVEEKEVKKIFKLGKKGKTISILIKNNKTRKLIEDSKIDRKKKNLATIKNYLKDKNLIKFGSTAPSKLLRELYETAELCGGVVNENKDVLIHNFDK